MENYNRLFVKIGLAVPSVSLGKPLANAKELIRLINSQQKAAILVFPEMSLTGVNLQDWLYNQQLLEDASNALAYLLKHNEQLIVIGHFIEYQRSLYNAVFVIDHGQILAVVPENGCPLNELPNRTINIADQEVVVGQVLFTNGDFTFGVELGSQLWHSKPHHEKLFQAGADIVICCAASPFHISNARHRLQLAINNSLLGLGAFVYSSAGITETSSGQVYSGHQIACQLGKILTSNEDYDGSTPIQYADIDIECIKYAKRRHHLLNGNRQDHIVDMPKVMFSIPVYHSYLFDTPPSKTPFYLSRSECDSTIDAITAAIHKRLSHIGISNMVIGVSGGVDSTLTLLMACETTRRYGLHLDNIYAITMPSLPTSKRSLNDATKLMTKLNVNCETIAIGQSVDAVLAQLNHQEHDVVYENVQARYRTLLLLSKANQVNGLMLGTGDMTEGALGFCTFGGDMVAMYNPNGGLPKSTVRQLVAHFKSLYPEVNHELTSILTSPISPELLPNQETEKILGSYEINDFIMYELLANGSSQKRLVFLLEHLFSISEQEATAYYQNFVRRFKASQFKRYSMPESVKIFEIDLLTNHIPGDLK